MDVLTFLFVSALIAALAIIFALGWALLANRKDEEWIVRHLEHVRAQSYNPDSAYFRDTAPKCQFEILVDDLGGATIVGHGWRYEDFLITCGHVVESAKLKNGPVSPVYLRHRIVDKTGKSLTTLQKFESFEWSMLAADVAVTRYVQSEFPYMASANVKSVTQPIVAKIVTAFPNDNASLGTIEHFKFGVLQYGGSTRGGFSGAPYMVDNRVVAMHLAGGVTNIAYAATYLANLVRRQESSEDEILRRMVLSEDEIEYDEVTPDEVQVHYRGQYYMYDRDEFFRELNSRKALSKRADRYVEDASGRLLESGTERVSCNASTQTTKPIRAGMAIASTQTQRGTGVVSTGVQTTPKMQNSSTQTKARIVFERGPQIKEELNRGPRVGYTPAGNMIVWDAEGEAPSLHPGDNLVEEVEEQLEAAEDFLTDDEDDFEPAPVSGNEELPASKKSLETLAGSVSALTDLMQQVILNMCQVPNMDVWNESCAAINGLRTEQKQLRDRFDNMFRSMEKRVIPPPIERSVLNLESSIPSSTQLSSKLEKQLAQPVKTIRGGAESSAPSICVRDVALATSERVEQLGRLLDGTGSSVLTKQDKNNSAKLSTESLSISGDKRKRTKRKAKAGKQQAQSSTTQTTSSSS